MRKSGYASCSLNLTSTPFPRVGLTTSLPCLLSFTRSRMGPNFLCQFRKVSIQFPTFFPKNSRLAFARPSGEGLCFSFSRRRSSCGAFFTSAIRFRREVIFWTSSFCAVLMRSKSLLNSFRRVNTSLTPPRILLICFYPAVVPVGSAIFPSPFGGPLETMQSVQGT